MTGALANARAVMASRVEDPGSLDYFPSPPWWGRAIGETLAGLGLPLGRVVEEPAAGEGHLAHGLADVWPTVRTSDIHPWPQRGDARPLIARDYLATGADPRSRPDWTVTNPPFEDRIEAFTRRACGRSRIGAVMVMQLGQLEGKDRLRLFADCGLYAVIVPPRKGSGLRKGLWQPGLSSATRYGFFVYVRPGVVEGWAGFSREARTVWLDWETAERLTRDTDRAFAGLGS